MPKIGMTREQIHKRIFDAGILSRSSQRHAVTACITDLSHRDKWTASMFRLALKAMEENGDISKEKRYQLQQEFFPE